MRYAIGIDVGLDGAVAMVSEQGFEGVWDVPTLEVERPKDRKTKSKTMRIYDKAGMRLLLRRQLAKVADTDGPDLVQLVIEKVHAMPDQGATSMFSFGRGLGLWEGIVDAFEKPTHMPAPQTWKKAVMRDGPKTKEAAVPVAQALYPKAAPFLRGPQGGLKVDRAEAILMAHYGLILHTLPAPGSRKKSRGKAEPSTDDPQEDDGGDGDWPLK